MNNEENELEISISSDDLEKIMAYKKEAKVDSFGELLVNLIDSDRLIRDLESYREHLATIASAEEVKLEDLLKQILKNFISIHWVHSDSELTPFTEITKHAIALTSGYDSEAEKKLRAIQRKELKARNYLDEVVLPLLAKASHALMEHDFKVNISELSESHTISGNVHYKLKMIVKCPITNFHTSICFITSPQSGNLGARVLWRERTQSYRRIHLDDSSINDYCIETIKDFISKTMLR